MQPSHLIHYEPDDLLLAKEPPRLHGQAEGGAVGGTFYCVFSTFFSVLYTLYSVTCTLLSVLCNVYSVLFTVFYTLRSVL